MGLRVGVLTSNDIRHRYFANAIAAQCDVAAVGYQDTGYAPAGEADAAGGAAEASLVRYHFNERRRQEERFFGDDAAFRRDGRDAMVLRMSRDALNSDETVRFLESASVDVVVVYGTSLIKEPLLARYDGRLINMHLGLSPYYRGTATNFYPLVNDEPEYVGATIHLIDRGIDSGEIVHQARPEITADDMPHTVGCKAILAGIEKMIQTLGEYARGRIEKVRQWPVAQPRLYLRKDYQTSHVVRLYELVFAGLFPRYLNRSHRVRDLVRIVE